MNHAQFYVNGNTVYLAVHTVSILFLSSYIQWKLKGLSMQCYGHSPYLIFLKIIWSSGGLKGATKKSI